MKVMQEIKGITGLIGIWITVAFGNFLGFIIEYSQQIKDVLQMLSYTAAILASLAYAGYYLKKTFTKSA
jgi:FtsH-binding integral membrane protein